MLLLIVKWTGVAAGFLAAAFWFWSAWLKVPDNIDTIVGELQRISRFSGYGALAASAAAICAVIVLVAEG